MVIAEFYAGKSVLLTGCTGFVGKVLLEQFLRSIPTIGRLFVLIRAKKNASAADRLHKEIFLSPIFERLRAEVDNFEEYFFARCVAIEGDVEKDGLGMSPDDLAMVMREANVLVGCAANVDFNERLDLQLETNVQGSLRMLDLAKRCVQLDALVHVSTAYINANRRGRIRERLPEGRLREAEAVVERVKNMSPEEVVKATPSILGRYPNTYTFSKMITERLLMLRRETVPLVILRPTIVGASWRDPVPGWVDSVSAAAALYLACGTGLVKVLHAHTHMIGDQIPVDLVCNAIIASVPRIARQDRIDVYHSGSSDNNPVTWDATVYHWEQYWSNRLPDKRLSPPDLVMTPSKIRFYIRWFLQYETTRYYLRARAALTNADADKINVKRWNNIVDKARALSDAFHPFVTNEWIFESTALDRLMTEMSPHDLELFPLDVREINWFRYLSNFHFGLHRFILKEDVGPPLMSQNMLLPYAKSSRRDELVTHSPYAVRTDLGWALEVGSANGDALAMKNLDNFDMGKVVERVLRSKAVRAAIAEEGENSGMSRQEVQKRAEEVARTMAASMKMPIAMSFGWVMQKIMQRMFEGILVDPEEMARVRAAAARGQVVIVPTHQSYFDFIIVSVFCKIYDIPLPHIASADDFLNLAVIAWLFRSSGAFFMRRTLDTDALYTAIFGEYCKTLIRDAIPVEFFIEGTRSRTGKMLQPKLGLLSLLVEGFLERESKASPGRGSESCDLFIVPISISYDLVPESASYPDELLGRQKVKESFSALMGAYSVLFKNYGQAVVSIATPFSLRSFCAARLPPIPRGVATSRIPARREGFSQCVKDLSTTITDQLISKSVIMSPGIISAALLHNPSGLSLKDLIAEVGYIRRQILDRGMSCHDTSNPREMTIRGLEFVNGRGCELRGEGHTRAEKIMAGEEGGAVGAVAVAQQEGAEDFVVPLPALGRLHLAFFRNQLLHVFVSEALIALSHSAACSDAGCDSPSLDQVKRRFVQLYGLFTQEFIWRRGATPLEEFEATLRFMIRKQYFILSPSQTLSVPPPSSHPDACRYLAFISSLFHPFIDSYWSATMSLFALLQEGGGERESEFVGEEGLPSSPSSPFNGDNNASSSSSPSPSSGGGGSGGVVGIKLLDRGHRAAHALVQRGTLPFYESCSLDTLRNALTYLQTMGVVVRRSEKGAETLSRRGIVELSEKYRTSAALQSLADSIGAFRSLHSQSVNGQELLAMLLPRSRL